MMSSPWCHFFMRRFLPFRNFRLSLLLWKIDFNIFPTRTSPSGRKGPGSRATDIPRFNIFRPSASASLFPPELYNGLLRSKLAIQ